jgi:hypothetical protein
MMNWHLNYPRPAAFQLMYKLHADCPARRPQIDILQEAAPDQPKIAVHICELYPKQTAHKSFVGSACYRAIPRIVARHFISVHQSYIGL